MNQHLTINYYKPFSLSYTKAYIITMRPYLLFVSGITGIAGMSFAENIPLLKLILIFMAAFLSYGFGQALTDCFQTDTDSISSPYRPLTQKVVSKKAFIIISLAGLSFCVSVMAFYYPANLIYGAAAGLGLATYTYFKRRWWGGPFYNSWIVLVLFLMSYFASAGNDLSSTLIQVMLAVFFGYANFVLSGYFKDIEADRATGYNTLPVVRGRKISARVSHIFAGITLLSGFIAIINQDNLFLNPISLILLLSAAVCSLYAQILLHNVNTDEEAHKAVSPVVLSYILLLSGIAFNNKPEWLLWILIFILSYLAVLRARPSREQI